MADSFRDEIGSSAKVDWYSEYPHAANTKITKIKQVFMLNISRLLLYIFTI